MKIFLALKTKNKKLINFRRKQNKIRMQNDIKVFDIYN